MKMRSIQRRSRWQLFVALIAVATYAISACGSASDQQVIAGNQADGLAGTEKPDISELSARELVIAAMNTDLAESSRASATTDIGGAVQEQEHEIDEHGNTRTITRFELGLEDPEAQASVEMLVVDDEVYGRINFPEELRGELGIDFPEGWLTLGHETMELFGLSCGPPLLASGADGVECVPPNDLSEMADFVLEATIVGPETVSGVETVRVQSVLDLKSLMEAALSEAVDGGLMGVVLASMPSEVPIELWVDDDLRTHRMSMELTMNFEALGEELGSEIDEAPTAIIVMDFYDFGADIVIEAPPSDEIVGEFGDWLEKLGFPGLVEDPISTA